MKVRRSLELRNTLPGHNKFYRITIEELTKVEAELRKFQQWRRFILRAHWGPIGNVGVSQEKGAFESYQMANRAATPLIHSKTSKGYQVSSDLNIPPPSTTHPVLLVKNKGSAPSPAPAKPESPDLSRFSNIELL